MKDLEILTLSYLNASLIKQDKSALGTGLPLQEIAPFMARLHEEVNSF